MSSSKYSTFLLSILGALLLWAAWPNSPFTFLIFVAWLPLFFLADRLLGWKQFLGYTFFMMLAWNVLTTWWIAKSTIPGGIAAFVVNSLIMCIPWMLYYFSQKYFSRVIAGLAFISFWITYEYIHHNWDLSWPWLTLGNAFATRTAWVQWYEYTGSTGGTLWILLSNVLLFHVLKLYAEEGRSIRYFKNMIAWVLLLSLPVFISRMINANPVLEHNKYNAVVVQPNFDPWDEKFEAGKQEAHLQKLIALSQQNIDANTALVVWPETAIPFQTDEQRLKDNLLLSPLWGFVKHNPQINLLTGLEGVKQFDKKVSRFAQKFRDVNFYYEMYNSALLADSSSIQIYHKSKLVPGVEVLPSFLNFMAPIFDKFGGTTGGYAKDSIARVLATTNGSFKIAPAICYESIYSNYLTAFMRHDANLICIITNDGWWGNTQGYKQHMNYARLRAIENRRWVARSANTGISCFIDPKGNIIQQLPWNVQGSIKQDIAAFVTKTFFAKHGDYLSKIFSVLSIILSLLLLYLAFSKKSRKRFI